MRRLSEKHLRELHNYVRDGDSAWVAVPRTWVLNLIGEALVARERAAIPRGLTTTTKAARERRRVRP